jgi:CBS domain containing-hemolysin-like protein
MDSAGSPGGMPTWLGLLSVAVLVAGNAYFVAAEFALVGSRKTRLDEMAQAGDKRAALARKALQHLDRYISATQLGITLASLGLGWMGEPALARLVEVAVLKLAWGIDEVTKHGIATALVFCILTALHIILGELVPKAIALLHPEEVSRWVAGPLIAFSWVMALPISLLNGTANRLLRVVGITAAGETERLHSPEEIRMLVEQSHEGGSLQKEDARLLEGVFEFSEKNAEQVMTPRTGVVAFPADLAIGDAADRAVVAELSRYPVYDGTLDQVIGVVHAKDLLSALRSRREGRVRELMRPPLFVPATKEVEDVLADMKRMKVHLAVVLDEHGGTLGIVTMEDLLEEIVGPILDEYDEPEVAAHEVAGAILLEGATPLVDFNSEHGTSLDDSYYNTIGGWVFGRIGRLPRKGDVVEEDGWAFEVARMDGHRVAALLARRPASEGDATAAGAGEA